MGDFSDVTLVCEDGKQVVEVRGVGRKQQVKSLLDFTIAYANLMGELGRQEPMVLQHATCHYARMLEWTKSHGWEPMYSCDHTIRAWIWAGRISWAYCSGDPGRTAELGQVLVDLLEEREARRELDPRRVQRLPHVDRQPGRRGVPPTTRWESDSLSHTNTCCAALEARRRRRSAPRAAGQVACGDLAEDLGGAVCGAALARLALVGECAPEVRDPRGVMLAELRVELERAVGQEEDRLLPVGREDLELHDVCHKVVAELEGQLAQLIDPRLRWVGARRDERLAVGAELEDKTDLVLHGRAHLVEYSSARVR